MDGMPIAVQIIGRRLMEEQVLAGMKEVKEAVEAWSEGHSHDVRTVWTPSL